MADNNCPYHSDHNSRIKKLEQNCDDLDDRVTVLDKEFAVNRAEITGILKNLEKLPETMTQMTNAMVAIQNEIKTSNTVTESRIQGVEAKLDSNFIDVEEKIKTMNSKVSNLDTKVLKINEDDTINIRHGFKNWLLKNWMSIGLGVLLAGLYIAGVLKTMVSQ